VHRGTHLVRMDAAASTQEEWVAYAADAGLSGFSTTVTPRTCDTGGQRSLLALGGVANETIVLTQGP
jgi:hypothetical protein